MQFYVTNFTSLAAWLTLVLCVLKCTYFVFSLCVLNIQCLFFGKDKCVYISCIRDDHGCQPSQLSSEKKTSLIQFLAVIRLHCRYHLLSLHIAEYVHPQEWGAAHVDDTKLRRNQHKVDGLCGQPEQAWPLECWHKLLLALLGDVALSLHDGHATIKDDQKRWRENELIQQQLTHNDAFCGARKGSVEPFVPVVEDGRVDQCAHYRIAAENRLVDVLRRWRLL